MTGRQNYKRLNRFTFGACAFHLTNLAHCDAGRDFFGKTRDAQRLLASQRGAMNFRGLLNLGATYAIDENVVLDAGVNIGLTGDVPDVIVFSGITVRF